MSYFSTLKQNPIFKPMVVMEEAIQQTEREDNMNKILIEEIDPEEINKLWDSLPEIKAVF